VLDEIALSYPDRTLVLEQACPCEGEWDRDRIAQVATNLIVNAVKHGAADRPITVRVGIEGDEAHLEVHNDGPAIPPGRLATIFEPFTTASKPALDSLGLGLTIVREIVSAHGGHVDVSSSDEQGTTFRIGLPVRGGSAPG
jgi:signal transduction histidine kinase